MFHLSLSVRHHSVNHELHPLFILLNTICLFLSVSPHSVNQRRLPIHFTTYCLFIFTIPPSFSNRPRNALAGRSGPPTDGEAMGRPWFYVRDIQQEARLSCGTRRQVRVAADLLGRTLPSPSACFTLLSSFSLSFFWDPFNFRLLVLRCSFFLCMFLFFLFRSWLFVILRARDTSYVYI